MNVWNLATVLFIILKVVGVINWSWWLVFLPASLSVAYTILVIVGMILVAWLASFPAK